jgi:hypothetical protein
MAWSLARSCRAVEGVTVSAASCAAPAGELRLAMIGYRALFRDLLGDPADAQTGPVAGPTQLTGDDIPVIEADGTAPGKSDTQAAKPPPDACCGLIPPMDIRAAGGVM